MKKFLLFFIFLFFLFRKIAFGAEPGDVIINEIFWKGENEWIELKNETQNEINLSGWQIENARAAKEPLIFDQNLSFLIPGNGYFLICSSKSNLSDCDLYTSISLNDNYKDNGSLILKENQKIIDQIPRVETSNWPAGNEKSSMQRKFDENKKALPGEDPNSWEENQNPSPQSSGILLKADAGQNIISQTDTEIIFDASNSKGNIEKYIWNLGDGSEKEGKVVSHRYKVSGKYFVTLKVISQGKESKDSIEVRIYPKDIFISEFSPQEKWVEISNESSFFEEISFFEISTKNEPKTGFIFPENTFIEKNSFLLIPDLLGKLSFEKEGSLFLFFPSGDLKQEIKYKEMKGFSIAKKGKEYFYTKIKTPGMPNVISKEEITKPSASQKTSGILQEAKSPPAPKKVLGAFLSQAQTKKLILATLGIFLFSGISGFSLIKLKRKMERSRQKNSKEEIVKIEIEKD